ncbi:adhesion G protein-coupled receptor B1-like [Pomacea canaliculata]|uniref:adhesion G protein-coupled receptor B1-like n=1 Tax=Pomacea canaliculata TaxID=400727 RepID=UPI000D72F0EF|nr:adhesion G protein-coupled receptor B1-like [Pomacea canaliculata]
MCIKAVAGRLVDYVASVQTSSVIVRKSNCQENFWKVYCRQTCNECVDQTTGGHVRDETATSTTTTTATRTHYPPEITSYTDKQVFSAGETVTLTCRSKNTRDTRGALSWHSSRNGVRNITREASDGSIQLDILQISTEYDGMSVTCVEKGKIADTLSSITIRVDMSSVWGQWETWSACSATCGDGSRSRRRSCSVTRGACQGEATQTDTCNITACCVPQHGRWSDWSSWSSCSVSCGQGTRTRSRTCSGQNVCGRPCEGNNVAKEYCNPSKCPAWGSWSSWTCSVTCGTGTMSRTRTCTPPSATCSGDASDQQECQRPACCVPTHGQWNDWGSWSSCSVSCGEGTRTRLRTCSEPNACGHCEGNNVTEEYCNDYVCPGKCR